MKKNNKGFSLVELIVVVLILGILAVAVTPQVMKWVEKSKISSDKDNANALKSSVQTALAEWQATNNLPGADKDYSATVKGGATITADTNWPGLNTLIDEVTAGDYPKTQYDSDGFVVTVDGESGKVTVSCGAQSK